MRIDIWKGLLDRLRQSELQLGETIETNFKNALLANNVHVEARVEAQFLTMKGQTLAELAALKDKIEQMAAKLDQAEPKLNEMEAKLERVARELRVLNFEMNYFSEPRSLRGLLRALRQEWWQKAATPNPMRASLIICTRNRAGQLAECLRHIRAVKPAESIELILVDNGSTDDSKEIIEQHMRGSSLFPCTYVFCEEAGLGSARNAGVKESHGEWLIFSDDDCYLEPDFFIKFFKALNESSSGNAILYGSGEIQIYDCEDDMGVAHLAVEEMQMLKPFTVLSAGTVQGANMFFHRSVFEKVGLFNEKMGAGTAFPCEDIEMATRASFAGFWGAQVPGFKVLHHHKRKTGSMEAVLAKENYDYGRGAYYASLIANGVSQAWYVWGLESTKDDCNGVSRLKLARELLGAFKYIQAHSPTDNKLTLAFSEALNRTGSVGGHFV